MNQILLTNTIDSKKKNKSNKYKNSNNNDMKKIIIFFGVAILVFGIAIVSVYAYRLYNKNNGKINKNNIPQLVLEEKGEEFTIIVKSEIGINKIIYSWNEEDPEEIEIGGKTSYEEKMDIPEGENTLNVKVIDENGQENQTSKTFSRIKNDEEKPIIETSIIENAKLKITATDETAMKYITYKWDDEEEVKIDAENEDDQTIETTIDVKRGQNTLIITAVDSSDNEETIEKIFKGVNDPVIEVTRDGNKIYMKITHDMGFKKIEFSINDQTYNYDETFSGYDATKKEVEFKFDLKEGENTVIIHAVSLEDTEKTYKGKCNYTAE